MLHLRYNSMGLKKLVTGREANLSASNYFTYKPQKLSPFPHKNGTLIHIEGKSKFNSRTGHEGPEGEHTYSSTIPSTSALEVDWCSTPRSTALPLGKTEYPLYSRLAGTQGRSGRVR